MLPAQAPLKDFIHHNTLHAFQHLPFFDGIRQASDRLGYQTSFSLSQYRVLYAEGKIDERILDKLITFQFGAEYKEDFLNRMLHHKYHQEKSSAIGRLRAGWREHLGCDLDTFVHPILFRMLCSYLDQGIAIWSFPTRDKGFIEAITELEKNGLVSIFRKKKARQLLLKGNLTIEGLLDIVVGDPALYKQYLFDQQFAHQGWSGMVSSIESNPAALLDKRNISLHDLIIFDLLLEIDALDYHAKDTWKPLAHYIKGFIVDLFDEKPVSEKDKIMQIFQEAFEWTYYDEVLTALQFKKPEHAEQKSQSLQALFCIDDRECSLRRSVEKIDNHAQTFGTPGFFGVEFFFQPAEGKFFDKHCPMPINPNVLIKEVDTLSQWKNDPHFTKHSHDMFTGWLISQTLGFWSAFKLFLNIFKPSAGPASSAAFRHMDRAANLTIENRDTNHREHGLQVGFTTEQMTARVEGVLRSIGLVSGFAPLVYVVGHGASSVNNPHYAAYDCGACSGRPGSVNARVFAYMANHKVVRQQLALRGIEIPDNIYFIGGLHDTTRDDIMFYDESMLSDVQVIRHTKNVEIFNKALELNANERARRFELVSKSQAPADVHHQLQLRSVSLFETRPELNHATNALCIVGRRDLTRNVFLDRRAFLNSYNYRIDPDGKFLLNILRAAAPVCGGINLEYFFSRVDNAKLGAGTKLPHNVMGLIGVANGIDGDLRPGLPSQMIEVHDPVRMMLVVEQFPDVVQNTLDSHAETKQWFTNEWIHLVVIQPETKELFQFVSNKFVPYSTIHSKVTPMSDLERIMTYHQDNLPVAIIN